MIDETGKLKRPIESRKAQFDRITRFVRSKNAWLISIPGDREARLECLSGRGAGPDDEGRLPSRRIRAIVVAPMASLAR
jgi:hypothetical protein